MFKYLENVCTPISTEVNFQSYIQISLIYDVNEF